jgi:hypothetical protein
MRSLSADTLFVFSSSSMYWLANGRLKKTIISQVSKQGIIMRLLELVWNNELEQRIFIHNKANHIKFW